MKLAELAALVMPKTVKARKAKAGKAKPVRPQGRRDLGYHPFTDTWRPIPWECDDPEALTLADAHNVLAGHNWADHPAGECAITRTALAVVKAAMGPRAATAEELSAKRIRQTRLNAPTVRTKAVSLQGLVDASTRPD